MAINLVSIIMQFVTPDIVAKIASSAGLDRNVAQKAIDGGVPALLAGFAGLSSKPGGAQQLSNALTQQQPGALDSLINALGGSGQKGLADSGAGLLSSLLGNQGMSGLISAISNFAGIGQGASKSLLGLLGPMVMGVLGKHLGGSGIGPSGLANLLNSQKNAIAAAVPSSLANELSSNELFHGVEGLQSSIASASSRMDRIGDGAIAGANQASAAARKASSSQWPYWVAGLVVLAGLSWYLLNRQEPQVASNPPALQGTVGQGTVGLAPADLTVGGVNVANQVTSLVGATKTTLEGITDSASARAALPRLQATSTQLARISSLAEQLPPDRRQALASMIASAKPALDQVFEKVLATPGAGMIAKPAIDAMRAKIDALSRT